MSAQQQWKFDDEAVRSAFLEHSPFRKKSPLPDEDLRACLDAQYDTSDGGESFESLEPRETDPLMAAGDQTTFMPSSRNRPVRQHVLESYYVVLDPRRRRGSSPASNIVRTKCTNFGCIVLGLILLGSIFLWSPVLKAMLFPEEQGVTTPVQALT